MPLNPLDISPVARTPDEVDRLFPWLRSDTLRGIPHFISPAWTGDRSRFDAIKYAKTWKQIGFDSVTLLTVHHDGYYLYPSEFTRNQPDRDYFGEQVKACSEEGIRSIGYYSLTLNSLVGAEHPEWRIRDLHDRVLVPDHRYFFHYDWLCVNSPFRDFAIAQMTEIVSRYHLDAIWMDILYLPPHPHPDDPFLKPDQDTCFCECCHRAYTDWYRGENLFDAVGTPRHDEFRAESYRRFVFDLKKNLLSVGRPIAVTFNGAGRRRCPFYERLDPLADWCSGEAHNMPTRSIFSKVLTQDGLPMELMSCSELVWSHNVSKPTQLVSLEAVNTLLHGGTYTLGINHAPDGRLQQGNVDRLVRWGQWIKNKAPSLREGTLISEVGLLEAGQPLLISNPGFVRWVDFLSKSHFLFSLERNLDVTRWPRCMIVPKGLHLTEEIAACLESYVRQGGRLLIEGPMMRQHKDGCYILQDLAGVEAAGTMEARAFYLQPSAKTSSGLIPDEPVYYQCGNAAVMHIRSGTVLADLVPQFADKTRLTDIQIAPNYPARPDQAIFHPGVVINSHGKGTVMTTALTLTCPDSEKARHPWPRLFAANLVRHLLGGKQAVGISGHEAVEIVAKRHDEEVALHFLNHYYDVGEFISGEENSVRLQPIPIKLDVRFFKLGPNLLVATEKTSFEIKAAEGIAGFLLPALELHTSVRLSNSSFAVPRGETAVPVLEKAGIQEN